MTHRPFQLVDVFHDGPFTGNPLAVVFDADDLDEVAMQSITRWLNLSETAFLLRPSSSAADYRVRIFTLERELPFAGHPTLGSCHAWLSRVGSPAEDAQIVQECGAGLVRIRRSDEWLSFAAPPMIRSGAVDEATISRLADFLQIGRHEIKAAQWADNGPGWVAVLLDSADAVLGLEPRRSFAGRIDVGVVGPHRADQPAAFEVRAFFTDQHGAVREDPVTGSLNASIAGWLLSSGRATAPYVASQGTRLGRSGRIKIHQDTQGLWIGGRTITLFSGNATI